MTREASTEVSPGKRIVAWALFGAWIGLLIGVACVPGAPHGGGAFAYLVLLPFLATASVGPPLILGAALGALVGWATGLRGARKEARSPKDPPPKP